MNKLITALIALGALAVGIILFTKLNQPEKPEFALHYQQPRAVKPFTLEDHQGEIFNNQALVGQWTWVFFGYTNCPDVCPTTLQEMNFVYDDLKAIAANNQVVLVSVDPQRDSQTKLASYIAYFNKEFKAVRGGHDALFPFARNLGLMYAITDTTQDSTETKGSYLVDHSASLVLINPQGNVSAIFKPRQELGHIPTIEGDKLVSDFARIVALY
jgi:protein SCO1/2